MHLRRSDIELCHPMGREMKVGVTRDKKREVCVRFLVRGRGGEIRHRWVSKMAVHLNNGREKGMENVAS